jgi:hypothetical protein
MEEKHISGTRRRNELEKLSNCSGESQELESPDSRLTKQFHPQPNFTQGVKLHGFQKCITFAFVVLFSARGCLGTTAKPSRFAVHARFRDRFYSPANLSIGIKAPVISKPGAIPFAITCFIRGSSCQGIVQRESECGLRLPESGTTVSSTVRWVELSVSCRSFHEWELWSLLRSHADKWDHLLATAERTRSTPTYALSHQMDRRMSAVNRLTQVETGGTLCDHPFTDYTHDGWDTLVPSRGILSQSVLFFPTGSTYTGLEHRSDPFGNTITSKAQEPTPTR